MCLNWAEPSPEWHSTISLGQQMMQFYSIIIKLAISSECFFNSSLSIFDSCPDGSSSLTRFLCLRFLIEPLLGKYSIYGPTDEAQTGLMTNFHPIVFRLNLIMQYAARSEDKTPNFHFTVH